MVVVVIDEHRVFAFESEGESPVAAYRDCPVIFQVAMQGMQLPPRRVHVFCRAGVVERKQLLAKALGMAGLDFGFRPGPEEQLDSLVTKASDHSYSV
jgi:hypothetical protein